MREAPTSNLYHFDGMAFDPDTGDVTHRDGSKVRLRPQAAKVLTLLLDHSGDLVDRTRIREAVWANTIVEFDQGMNACIREIRRALGDSATDPRYVETLPRRGYRFLRSLDVWPSMNGELTGRGASQHGRQDRFRPSWARTSGAVVAAAFLAWGATLLIPGPTRDAQRLLVIPFANASTEPSGDTVAAILSDRLIAHLARIDPGLLAVIARTSSMRYAASPDPLAATAGELDLDLALEGSIARDRGMSVDLRLIDPEAESQVWAASFDLDPSHLAVALDEISRAIARAIDPAILEAMETTSSPNVGDLAARDAALRIEYLLAQHTMEATRRADSLLVTALEMDGDDLRLRVALAEVRRRLGDTDQAEELARDVLRMEESADAHRILAALAQRRMEWKVAESHIQKAIALAPGDPAHLHVASFVSAYQGDLAGAIDRMRRAQALDPISADLVADAGYVYIWAGDWAEAERRCGTAVTLDPENAAGLRCLVDLGWLTSSPERGEAAARAFLELADADVPAGSTAFETYWRRIASTESVSGCTPVWKAKGLLVLGRADEAAEVLRTTTRSAPRCLPSVAVDPFFDALRADPEIGDALTSVRMGWAKE